MRKWLKAFWTNHICGGLSQAEEAQDERDAFDKAMAKLYYKMDHFCHSPNDYKRMEDDVARLACVFTSDEFAPFLAKALTDLRDYKTGMRIMRLNHTKVG